MWKTRSGNCTENWRQASVSPRRVGSLPAFERLLRVRTMISILEKRQEGQTYTVTTTLSNFYAYYPRSRRIQLLTAFCPASTAIFGSRQGFATLLERTTSWSFCLWPAATHSTTVRSIEFRLRRPPQPLTRRPQFPLICVHQRTNPFVWHNTNLQFAVPPFDYRRGAEACGLEIYVDILPVARRCFVEFVVKADIGVFLCCFL
jgi:hypothetical protein